MTGQKHLETLTYNEEKLYIHFEAKIFYIVSRKSLPTKKFSILKSECISKRKQSEITLKDALTRNQQSDLKIAEGQ